MPTTNSSAPSGSSDVPDKSHLYGKFQKNADAREKLAMKAAYKSLDIAEDDMEINSSKVTNVNGIGWKELVVIAAIGLGGTGLYLWGNKSAGTSNPTVPTVTTDTTDTDTNTQYVVEAMEGE